MYKIEKHLETENKLPIFPKRFADDTLSAMPDPEAASEFPARLNRSHPSVDFTMELEENGRPPFPGMTVIRNGCRLDTSVYRKPTDTGLLLHYHNHVDARYKRSLLKTMLNRAFKLSPTWKFKCVIISLTLFLYLFIYLSISWKAFIGSFPGRRSWGLCALSYSDQLIWRVKHPSLFTSKGELPDKKTGCSSKMFVVYSLLGKTGWPTVVANGTCQIQNGNFHGDALVSFYSFLLKDRIKRDPRQKS